MFSDSSGLSAVQRVVQPARRPDATRRLYLWLKSDRAPVALADAGWTRDPAEGDPPGFWVELATRHSPPASDCGCSRFGETPRREEGWVLGRVWGYEGLRVAESNTEAAQI